MGPSRHRIAAVLAALTLIVAVGAAVATADSTLIVADADTDERLLSIPVDEGETITLSYTHSVEKTPVRDVYVVDGERLRMVRMEFDSYGAGLPSAVPVDRTEDGILVAEMNRTYDRLDVVPGSIANHSLVVDGTAYDLTALADGGVVVYVIDRTVRDAVARAAGTAA